MKKLLKLLFNRKRMLLIDLDKLRDDAGFRIGWESNIAMAMKDEFALHLIRRKCEKPEDFHKFMDSEIHDIANKGASKFIDLLTHEHIGI